MIASRLGVVSAIRDLGCEIWDVGCLMWGVETRYSASVQVEVFERFEEFWNLGLGIWNLGLGLPRIKFVSHAFYRFNMISAGFFADFADMHIDCAFTNHNIIVPNPHQYVLAGEYFSGFCSKDTQ